MKFRLFRPLIVLVMLTATTFAAPDLDLFGGSGLDVEISAGDTTPRELDSTDWGDVRLTPTGNPVTRNFKIKNNGNENLLIVSHSNSNSADFTVSNLPNVAMPVSPGGSVLFQITFEASSEGQKSAVIGIVNTSGEPGENPFEFTVTANSIKYPEIVIQGRPSQTGATYTEISDGAPSSSFVDGTYFGTVNVGESVTHDFKVSNWGWGLLTYTAYDNSDQFSHTLASGDLIQSESQTFTITYTPTQKGSVNATFTVLNNDEDEGIYTFTIAGEATEPDITVRGGPGFTVGNRIDNGDSTPRTGDGTDFGTLHIDGGGVSNDFQIKNLDQGDLDMSSVELTGADAGEFSLTSAPGLLAPLGYLEERVFTVTFDPATAGIKTATVEIQSNDPDEDPYTFEILGIATGTPSIRVEGSDDGFGYNLFTNGATPLSEEYGTLFPAIEPGSGSATHTFAVTNTGTDTLTLGYSSNGGGFFLTGSGMVPELEPGFTTYFNIRFEPVEGGVASRTITLTTNAPGDETFTFDVQGTGDGPEILLRGGSAGVPIYSGDTTVQSADGTSFTSSYVNQTTDTSTFEVHNTGVSELSISGISIMDGLNSGQFSLTSSVPASVPAGESRSFDVTFAPTADGFSTATVVVESDDYNEGTYTFAIRGFAYDAPDIDVSGARPGETVLPIASGDSYTSGARALNFPDTPVGGTSTIEYTVENNGTGGVRLDYSVSCDNPVFQVTANGSGGLVIGSSEMFTIDFVPTGLGMETGTVTIANTDPNEDPYTFQIAGTAAAPDIQITGNGFVIPSGDTTPAVKDGTDFDDVLATSAGIRRTFRIENTGGVPLNPAGASLSGDTADFSISSIPINPLFPGSGRLFWITFDPQSLGQKTAVVSISSDDPDENPYTFTVTGNSVKQFSGKPDLEISGNGYLIGAGDNSPNPTDGTNFGSTVQGAAPAVMTFDMINRGSSIGGSIGSGDLTSISVSSGNPDVTVSGAPASLRPGESGSFTVNFSTATVGFQAATISVSSSDPNENPYTFAVALTVDPAPDPQPELSFEIIGNTGYASIQTESGKTYTLTTSTTLEEGSWIPVAGVAPVAGTGNLETIPFTMPFGLEPFRYYRIKVE